MKKKIFEKKSEFKCDRILKEADIAVFQIEEDDEIIDVDI